MREAPVASFSSEFGVRLVDRHTTPGPGETRAVGAIWKMMTTDEPRARITMQTLAESANNKAVLDREVIGAVFDLVGACRPYFEADPEKWFEVFDRTPVAELSAVAHDLKGFVPVRSALAGLIYERIWRAYGPRSMQPDLLDDRRMSR